MQREIQSTVRIIQMEEQESDFQFWQTRSYVERLEALEAIRAEYHQWKYGTEPRLQRVYRILKPE